MNIKLKATDRPDTWNVLVDDVVEPGIVVYKRGSEFFVDDGGAETKYDSREEVIAALTEYLQDSYNDYRDSAR